MKKNIYLSNMLEEMKDPITHQLFYSNTISDIFQNLNIERYITIEEFHNLLLKYLSENKLKYNLENSLGNDNNVYITFNDKKEAKNFISLLRKKF